MAAKPLCVRAQSKRLQKKRRGLMEKKRGKGEKRENPLRGEVNMCRRSPKKRPLGYPQSNLSDMSSVTRGGVTQAGESAYNVGGGERAEIQKKG